MKIKAQNQKHKPNNNRPNCSKYRRIQSRNKKLIRKNGHAADYRS